MNPKVITAFEDIFKLNWENERINIKGQRLNCIPYEGDFVLMSYKFGYII